MRTCKVYKNTVEQSDEAVSSALSRPAPSLPAAYRKRSARKGLARGAPRPATGGECGQRSRYAHGCEMSAGTWRLPHSAGVGC